MSRPRWALAAALFCALAAGPGAGASTSPPGETSERVFAFRADHMVLAAAVRGSRIYAGTQSGRVDVFDRSDGKPLGALIALEPAAGQAFAPTVRSLAISPSGASCAVASSDGKLRILDPEAGSAAEPSFGYERDGLLVVRFLDEQSLLLGDMRGELALLDLASGREAYRRQLDYDPIYAVVPSPDLRRAAIAFRSSRIQIVSTATGETLRMLTGHRDSVFGVAWLSDDRLASAGKDKQLLLWDLGRPEAAPRVLYAGDHYITALAADRDRDRLALPLEDHRVGLLRVSDGLITERLAGHTAPVQVLIFIDAGAGLVSAGNDARVLVWSLADEPGRGHR